MALTRPELALFPDWVKNLKIYDKQQLNAVHLLFICD